MCLVYDFYQRSPKIQPDMFGIFGKVHTLTKKSQIKGVWIQLATQHEFVKTEPTAESIKINNSSSIN